MASSLYSNAQHVDFESVLAMDDPVMVSMFEAHMASGLRGFLGCPAVVYEDALVDFFENASVRNGVVFSTVGGQIVEISEKLFAESFELPEARQENRTLDDVQTIRFNEFRKTVLAQNDSIFQGLADVRHEVEAVNAKVDIMASRLNSIQKDAEATKEALSHQLLELQNSAQENHNVIHSQLTGGNDMLAAGCPVVGREKLATGFPNDWLDQTMSYQLIQTTSFSMHPRLIEYNAVALDWMYKLPAGCS
ncbi:hypothetical protein F511_06569 [Dorcoceras hygrometricum]|uniref:Uncharacterized protein n=1 Tax=Dorcoceras hygrometricum TaxID=472368 RepID=A0A2Z7B6E6_9LAMI|nr:hypothetical protein F511_06569 [Dorcoceras hygrometricum]